MLIQSYLVFHNVLKMLTQNNFIKHLKNYKDVVLKIVLKIVLKNSRVHTTAK